MSPVSVSPLDAVIGVALLWLAIGFAAIVRPGPSGLHSRVLYPLGAAGGLILAIIGLMAIGLPWRAEVLPLGLPDLPFHVRLDALSAFFLFLLGAVSAGISCYAAGYFSGDEHPAPGHAPGFTCLQYHWFLASMTFVLIADDGYFFMVAWESMALTSYFLVTTEHREEAIRRAGFIYLLITHIGA